MVTAFRPLAWQLATLQSARPETRTVKTFRFDLPDWMQHKPGQHVDVRLTAPDGYQAQRSYSIASGPEQRGYVDLTVERIADGEVSTYLHDVLVQGDQVEMRGPIGGYFVWETSMAGPLLLIAGGSGVVPLMSILRHRAAAAPGVPARLLYSSRTFEDVIYADELNRMCSQSNGKFEVFHTLTRFQPPGWQGYARRIDSAMLQEVAAPFGKQPRVYICGPTLMVESAANALVALGLDPGLIKTERFGPTGIPAGGG